MNNQNFIHQTIGQIVADDFRAASVFKKAGIDFCCGGNKSLDEACSEKSLNKDNLVTELLNLSGSSISPALDYKNWDPGFLADYIMNTHHKFVMKNLPELLFYTRKIADVHGANHPELLEVADLFAGIDAELRQHLKMEEEVLFPAIKSVLNASSKEDKMTIKSEIARMTGEHESAGGAMDRINLLTNGYEIPADACNTYLVTMRQLEAFEDDLHVHVHLENNILFPKALQL